MAKQTQSIVTNKQRKQKKIRTEKQNLKSKREVSTTTKLSQQAPSLRTARGDEKMRETGNEVGPRPGLFKTMRPFSTKVAFLQGGSLNG